MRYLGLLQLISPAEILGVKGGFVECEETLDEECVIVCEAGGIAALGTVYTPQLAGLRVVEVLADEFRGADGVGEEFLTHFGTDLLQCVGGTGKVYDSEAVPSGDDLVVEIRARAIGIAVGSEFGTGGGEDGVDLVDGEREVFRELLGGGGNGKHVLVDEFVVSVVFGIDVAGAVDVVVFGDYGGVGFAEDCIEFVA